ncbi:hypothetical protein [Streptomyces antimycoticus]|nr:hypothetical protein [Streptomyces antimycoticus]
MRYTLQEAALVAEPRGIAVAVETHGAYTATPERSTAHGTHRESGADHQPRHRQQLPQRQRPARVAGDHRRPGHPPAHQGQLARDAARYRGKVRGMLGCACGEGVVDWERIVSTLATADHAVVHSVECASPEAATKSYAYLSELIGAHAP